MALMFQRLARNFVKNGYFPTDSETMSRILNVLAAEENARIIDPACGEGTALAECKHHLKAAAYGIELDEERAWHAKQLLDYCIHGDLMNCLIEKQGFGLLFLNPPYGDLAADNLGETRVTQGRQRLEKVFYQKTFPLLQKGGVMVLIIPYHSLDKELSNWLARHFAGVEVYLAPEQRFKQVVIFGIRSKLYELQKDVRDRLINIGQGKLPQTLPKVWDKKPYIVPAANKAQVKFVAQRLDERQLAAVVKDNPCLWKKFQLQFHRNFADVKRPLMDLSNWHLALALAAGQISGVVESHDNRKYLIKGDTYKTQQEKYEVSENAEKRILLDKFVPVIRAIDLNRESPMYGNVLTIQ